MARRINDPEIHALIYDLTEHQVGCTSVAALVGICTSSVRWVLKRRIAKEPVQDGTEDRPSCWVCGGRSETWDGHPQCRGRKAA